MRYTFDRLPMSVSEITCPRCTGTISARYAVLSDGPRGQQTYCNRCAKRISPSAWLRLTTSPPPGRAPGAGEGDDEG